MTEQTTAPSITLVPKDTAKGWKPWAPKSTIEKYGEENIPTLTDSEFVEILENRSKMGENVHGGQMINDFLKDQINPDEGDAIILLMSPFEEWHKVIAQYRGDETAESSEDSE